MIHQSYATTVYPDFHDEEKYYCSKILRCIVDHFPSILFLKNAGHLTIKYLIATYNLSHGTLFLVKLSINVDYKADPEKKTQFSRVSLILQV